MCRYDNPQLVLSYLSAFLLSEDRGGTQALRAKLGGGDFTAPAREAKYARTARDILDYMRRDMTHPEGGLFSAEVRLSLSVGVLGPRRYCPRRRVLGRIAEVQLRASRSRSEGHRAQGF